MEIISIVHISFPELRLRPSDGHKIRGYFARWWRNRSDLLHNHSQEGHSIYRYPLVQYKVIRQIPTIVGMGHGASILVEMFMDLEELIIGEQLFALSNKRIQSKQSGIGIVDQEQVYQFLSPWLALNQDNYKKWKEVDEGGRSRLLKGILLSNVLAFFKAVGVWVDDRITIGEFHLETINTNFKSQGMIAFKGRFTINAVIPDLIGLGKSTSRGYGIVQRIT